MSTEKREKGQEPTRQEVDQWPGPVLLEFGSNTCGHCQSLRPLLEDILREFPKVRHVRVEDGPGQPLGRSFEVKTWPNLVFLRDGQTISQLARPSPGQIREALGAITSEGLPA